MTHLGRLDSQIKIRGHRVELGEVEAAVREATGREAVLAVPWPQTADGYEGIEVFVEGRLSDPEGIRRRVGANLPEYMIPHRIHTIERMPLNANGKFDRKAVLLSLEQEAS
jgi:acyl-coenzyme A synthetase/AMP-(fatty) acid ligase